MDIFSWFSRVSQRVAKFFVGSRVPRLPRDQIVETLDDIIANSANGRYQASVLVTQIDNFARMEAAYKDHVLAKIIDEIEKRLIDGPCRRDVVRRLSEGKFAIVPTPLSPSDLPSLKTKAETVQATVAHKIHVEDEECFATLSVGYATHSQIKRPSGARILDAARFAERSATLKGKASIQSFDADLQANLSARGAQRKSISRAFESGAIHPFFQPQVCLSTWNVTGFEALARWMHPDKGMISPAEFLPQIEDLGMMPQLGFSMLDHALHALRDWRFAGFDIPTVSVNFSTEELRNPNLIKYVTLSLEKFDVSPESLVVEVLETVVAEQRSDNIQDNLKALSNLGCVIDLDDFGTGNASITAIRRFGVDRIKIDRSFVSHCDDDADKQSMIEVMVAMSDKLSVQTLAEGAESEAELAFLKGTDCHSVQGFGIAPPLAPGDVLAWLKDRRASTAAVSI